MSGTAITTDRAARFIELTSAERSPATLEEMFQRMTSRVPGVAGPEGAPEGLPAICEAWDVPYGRMLAWLMSDAARYGVYKRALEVVSHALVAETVGIADGEGFPQEKRVRIDTRFRVAKHHAPEVYGDRIEVHGSQTMEVVLERPALELLRLVRSNEAQQSEQPVLEVEIIKDDCPI